MQDSIRDTDNDFLKTLLCVHCNWKVAWRWSLSPLWPGTSILLHSLVPDTDPLLCLKPVKFISTYVFAPWLFTRPQATSIMHRTWTGDSFHIWYYTCFNAILPNHPTLFLSNRVQITVFKTKLRCYLSWRPYCNSFGLLVHIYMFILLYLTGYTAVIYFNIDCWACAWNV